MGGGEMQGVGGRESFVISESIELIPDKGINAQR